MVVQTLKFNMEHQLMATKLKVEKQTLVPTEGWNAKQWIRFFELQSVHLDLAFCEKLRSELVPTTEVRYPIAVLDIHALHEKYGQCQYHHVRTHAHVLGLVHPPCIEALCMFRKQFFYSELIKTFGAQRIIGLYRDTHQYMPQAQVIVGHRYDHDFLFVNPLHNNSPIAATGGIIYAG